MPDDSSPPPAPRRGRRDVIVANIGANARDVIVGKNIVKIGTLVIPTLPLLALLAVVVAALAWWGLNFLGPARMTARFNVAVAGIGALDASGGVRPSAEGTLVSRWMFDELVGQNGRQEAANRVLIWHDSLPLTQKRVRLGLIAGASSDERAAAAGKLAARIGADIVIYGVLAPDPAATPADRSPLTRLTVEFYVSPRLQGESAVTIGRYRLGESILIPAGFDAADTLAREALGSRVGTRAAALFWLVLGLRDDLLGRPADALAVLRRAQEQLPAWRERGEGKEILYFLIGRQALFLERDDEAEAALEQALAGNPGYARAEVVMGSVYFWRAQRALATGAEGVEQALALLNESLDHYRRAVDLALASAGPLVETLSRLGLASAYNLQGQAELFRDVPAAGSLFVQAVAEIQPLLEPLEQAGQYRLLAQAYDYLGVAYYQQGWIAARGGDHGAARSYYEQARDAHTRCLEQGVAAPEDDLLQSGSIAESCRRHSAAAEQALLGLEEDLP